MPTESMKDAAALERLSALADGELEPADAAAACTGWCGAAESRAAWHAYHVIGDVLRSEDLACDAARDAAFLVGVRQRLAGEPVVLAPRPLVAAPVRARGLRGWPWMASSAVAAGFVAVAGVYTLTRSIDPAPAAPIALSDAGRGPAAPEVASLRRGADPEIDPALGASASVAPGRIGRDPRLDA